MKHKADANKRAYFYPSLPSISTKWGNKQHQPVLKEVASQGYEQRATSNGKQ